MKSPKNFKEQFLKNIGELYSLQEKLDTNIKQKFHLDTKTTLPHRWLALNVELGELANETRCFKYWSMKEASAKSIILDEYVDCLHFILSIGLSLGQDKSFFSNKMFSVTFNKKNEKIAKLTLTNHFCDLFKEIAITRLASKLQLKVHHQKILIQFFQLGILLNFKWDEIYSGYLQKNVVNHERQVNNY